MTSTTVMYAGTLSVVVSRKEEIQSFQVKWLENLHGNCGSGNVFIGGFSAFSFVGNAATLEMLENGFKGLN
jgi:hypothetical protein